MHCLWQLIDTMNIFTVTQFYQISLRPHDMIGNADGTWFTKWKFHFHFQSLDAAEQKNRTMSYQVIEVIVRALFPGVTAGNAISTLKLPSYRVKTLFFPNFPIPFMIYSLVPIGPPPGKKIPGHWTLASVKIIPRNRNRECKYLRSEDLVSPSIFFCIVKDGFAC